MEAFLITLLQCTLSMSVITLLYAAVLPLLSKRYAPKWRYIVWLVIAAGWLIPFRPLIELPLLPARSTDTALMPVQPAPASLLINNAKGLTAAPETVTNAPQLSLWAISILVWSAGVLFLLFYHILRHRRFMKIADRWSEPVTALEILHLLDVLKQEQGIKAKIEYKTCSVVSSPMMVGFLHPVILMPLAQLSENELALILRHELTHFKRHDLWYKVMILAAALLHWFNPAVYFMARAAAVQCEISCDEYVLRNADMQTRKQYGETIIAVIRNGRTYQTALSTNFFGGKRGIKNRIASMLDNKRKKAGATVLCIVLAGIMLSGTTLVSAGSQAASFSNAEFAEDKYAQLLTLQFDGYKAMSVSEFQQRVRRAMDTEGYGELPERFYEDTQWKERKDTDNNTSFLLYELIPLTSESWKSVRFSDGVMTDYENADNAQLEYTCTLDISDADALTVGEYSQAGRAVMDGLLAFFKSRPQKELQDEAVIKKAIEAEIDILTKKWSSNALTVRIDYFFVPLKVYENHENAGDSGDTGLEELSSPNATEEDYRSLLKLKTADYQSRTLLDFNADLLKWTNEDTDRYHRIGDDTARNDFAVPLTSEELSFAALTVNYSGWENAVMVKNSLTGEKRENIGFGGYFLKRAPEQEKKETVWCLLYYQASYHITDSSRITVGERDRCVGGVIGDIQEFWDTTSLDTLLTMSKQEVLAGMESIARQYSSDLIAISIIPDQVSFEKMDERGFQN